MAGKWGKKGSLDDIIMFAIILFVLSLVTIIMYKVSDSLNDEFQASPQITTEGKAAMNTINNMYPTVVDNTTLFIVIALALMALIMAGLVMIHPIFLIPYIIVLCIVIFICAVLSNVYQEIAAQPEYATIAGDLTFTTHIMGDLPIIVGVIGSILAIIMFKIWGSNQ